MQGVVPALSEGIIEPASPGNPRNGEGAIVALPDGRLLLAWGRFRGPHDHSPADILARYSNDGGFTWGEPFLLQENLGRCNVMSVSFLALLSGDLLFGFLVKGHESADCHFCVRRSADGGRAWSPTTVVTPEEGYFVVNNDRLLQTGTGRVVVPVCQCLQPDYHALSTCYVSDDEGRTWHRSAEFIDISGHVGADEPGIVECADGSLWMYIRTDKRRIYACRSTDGGETWSTPEATELVAPTSPSSAKRLPGSDDILMIYNDRQAVRDIADDRVFQWRTPLTAAVSSDGGRTWHHHHLVEADQSRSYCYTSIEFYKDTTLLTYYVGRAGGPNLVDLKLRIVPTSAWTEG